MKTIKMLFYCRKAGNLSAISNKDYNFCKTNTFLKTDYFEKSEISECKNKSAKRKIEYKNAINKFFLFIYDFFKNRTTFKSVSAVFMAIILVISVNFYGCKSQVCAPPCGVATVVIDAGHGGIDPGVSGKVTKVRESDINLAIARLLNSFLKNQGVKTVMTRNTTDGLYGVPLKGHKKRDMKKRQEIINKNFPDVVVSIHQNEFSDKNKRGAQIYIKKGAEDSLKFGNIIKDNLKNIVAAGGCAVLYGDLFILNVSPCPAVIAECGFLSNAQDEALLITEDYQKKIAENIGSSVIEYLACRE